MRVSVRAAQALATSSRGSKRKSLGSSRRESDLQAAVLQAVNLIPGVVMWKSGAGAFRMTYKGKTRFVRMGKKGVSDLVGWKRYPLASLSGLMTIYGWARFIALEVKRPGEKPTLEQQAFLDTVKAAGGIAICARSVSDVAAGLGVG